MHIHVLDTIVEIKGRKFTLRELKQANEEDIARPPDLLEQHVIQALFKIIERQERLFFSNTTLTPPVERFPR